MDKKLKWLLLLLIVIAHKCPRRLAAELFEDQPKILVNDGNLIFESAESKNISIKLKGNSRLLVNGIDLLRKLAPANSTSSNSASNSDSNAIIDELRDQVKRLRNSIRGRDGILKRLERLENENPPSISNQNSTAAASNATRPSPTTTDRRRIVNLQRRVVTLENKLANLTERLTKDHCKSYPCQNGGTCFNMYDTFRCECPRSWEGPTCSVDVDECSRYRDTEFACQNGASCVNKPGSFDCICKDPWKGQLCSQKTVDCMNIANSEICGHGTCVQTKSKLGYTCICENGWRASNETLACTVDIDECKEMRPHCSNDPKVQCYNTPGSFICGACPAGYTGNGYSCVDVNECEIDNGGCSITPKVECINSRGSFRCSNCPLGYDGDGRVCLPSTRPDNQCSDDDKKLCSENAQCIKRPNTPPECYCSAGYTGSGYGRGGCVAQVFEPCTLKCLNNGVCTHRMNPNGTISQYCKCPPGTTAPLCELRNPCSPNPCLNGGNCTANGASIGRRYTCQCLRGFSGFNCRNQMQSKCDTGLKTGENGTIAIPRGDLGTYDNNLKCAWVIEVNRTKVINVTFNKFHVEESADCRYDWLQIHDGRTSAAPSIGRFCGTALPKGGNFISTHNNLYLWFRTDNSTSHGGFNLTWSAVDPVCGGEINATSHGIISSPGSPGRYPINRDCIWIITAPPSKRIQFLFYNLNIESHPTCKFDFVEIFARADAAKTSLGKFCNTTEPPPKVLTPDNVATIHFHSDGTNSDNGFQLTYSVQEGIPGCGGTFTASKGDITSPIDVVEGKYKHNIVCDYIIQLPPQTRIRIKFEKFKLEASSDCRFDRVELIEGNAYDESKLIGKFCGEKMPPVVTSLTNLMTLRFATDWTHSDEGFHAKYQIVCGGTYTIDNGNISSPGYPSPYNGDRTCEYDIVAPEGKVIVLNVLDLDVEKHSVCEFDNLEIFDFPSADNSTSLGRFCGQVKPGIVTSTYNHLHIHFAADASVSGRGFFASYSFVDVSCGGVISDASRVIRSPMSTDGNGIYQANSNCRWLVVAPKGYVIQMNFINFELELDAECKYDFVKVFNNASGKGEPMGPWCGTFAPKVITTIDNIATVLFHTDSSTGKEGFTISLSFIDANKLCNANYFSSHGIIVSPNQLGEYLPNKECEWIINVARGQQIELTFNYFEIEQHSTCKFDGLEVRNGGNSLAPLIGKFCGSDIPPPIHSFGNQLYLKFTSDSSRNGKGFELVWDGTLTGCGGVITSSKGSIASPQHPLAYPHNARCEWRISVNEGSTIEIIFTDLDFETQRECKYDYLEIFDGIDASATSLGRFCSSENHPMNLATSANHAFIRMNTDDSHANRGFYLKYKTQCNRTITDNAGIIESLNFPDEYPANIDCSWTIVVPKGNRIHMQFSHFELEHGEHDEFSGHICKYDYVEIYELDFKSKTQRGQRLKYCNHAPEVRNTTTDAVVINFHSDPSSSGSGFRLEWYLIGCGGKLTGRQSGELLSPNYPNPYPHSTTCFWEIEVDYGYDIVVAVNHLDIEYHANCEYDALKFSNDRSFNQTVTKLCTFIDSNSTVFTSHGHLLYVKFETDDSSSRRGFNVTYQRVPSTCGGKFISRTGVISTRNYPTQNYENNWICEWDIKTDISHTLVFRLLEFDLEDSAGCVHDKLEIIDTVFNRTLWVGCGNLKPNETVFNSKRNEMLIRLTTDSAITAKGFKANYTQSCGSKIIVDGTGTMDFEMTAGDETCEWNFIAKDPSQKVTLTFTLARMIAIGMINCTTSVDVFEGDEAGGPLRLRFCQPKLVPAIVSNGNALTVVLTTIHSRFGGTLGVTYSSLDNYCGAEYNRVSAGEFSSPLYPSSSPLGISCEWRVVASSGNRISLSVKSIDIASSPNCNDNYLEIRENDRSGALVGVFCGNEIPSSFPPAQIFWIKYQTDSISTNNGFLAAFAYNEKVELSGKSGAVDSPWYPAYGMSNREFYYRITVSQGSVIRFEFPDFYMENDDEEESSDSDELETTMDCDNYLRFFDGFDADSPVLGEDVCSTAPKVLTSTTNVVYLLASFDGRFKYRITWKEVEKLSNKTYSLNKCGDYAIALTNYSQTLNITSPGFPFGYDIAQHCIWTITSALQGYHPRFFFNRLDLEDGSGCLGDYVEISSDREDGSWKKMSKVCNLETQGTPRYFDGTPNLRVEFRSDYYANRTGFNATVGLICGGVMTGPDGVIAYGEQTLYQLYQFQTECIWNITVGRGKRIKFEFTHFNIFNTTDGCDSYLTLRNGIDASSPYLGAGKYCGTQLPQDIPETSSNRAFVKLKLAVFNPKRSNFTLKYSEVQHECGGTIRLTAKNSSKVISTPNYPNIPHPHSECLWSVLAPTGERVKIDFIERFDLRPSRNCSDEFVELKDGGTLMSPIIGSYCGLANPHSLRTRSNILNLKFFTDSGDPGNGFKANVSIDICGGMLKSQEGFVTSPRYPGLGAYPYNSLCDYRVVWTPNNVLHITFLDLNLPPKNGSECDKTKDYLEIFSVLPDDNSTDGESLASEGVFCGDVLPTDAVMSVSSTTLLRFQTFQKTTTLYRGFKVSFKAVATACGGAIDAESGVVTSPAYPAKMLSVKTCEWQITTTKGNRIVAEFEDIDIEQSIRRFNQKIGLLHDPRVPIASISSNNASKGPYYSSDNTMIVNFYVRNPSLNRGFKLNFRSEKSTICVGDLNQPSGQLTVPSQANGTITSYICTFNRDTSPIYDNHHERGTLAYYFKDISAGRIIGNCRGAPNVINVMRRSGVYEEKYLARICGNVSSTVTVVSPFPDVTIEVRKSYSFFGNISFTMTYKTHKCGGKLLGANEKIFKTPSSIESSDKVIDCAWYIKVQQGLSVKAVFNKLELKMPCESEWIDIFNGPTPANPKLGRYCGNQFNSEAIIADSNAMFIVYHADDFVGVAKDSLFEIQTKTETAGCGGVLTGYVTEFTSPLYDGGKTQYQPNTECIWDLTAQPNYHIGLAFIDRFSIQSSTNCTSDYVEVFDLKDSEWQSMGRVCGREQPKPFNSTSNKMRVVFHSDDNSNGDGFKAKWQSNCGGVYEADKVSKILSSPGYPIRYGKLMRCNYTITAPKGAFINVNFNDFHLEDRCGFDNLTMSKRQQFIVPAGWEKVGTFCGAKNPGKFRFAEAVNFVFNSDLWIEKKGWSLQYGLDDCGGTVTESGVIQSPEIVRDEVMNSYLGSMSCYWNITAPKDMKIIVRFQKFVLEYSETCLFDSVDVYNGTASDDKFRLARLCGNLTGTLKPLVIDHNQAMIKLKTDQTQKFEGFSAEILMKPKCNLKAELTSDNKEYVIDQSNKMFSDENECTFLITGEPLDVLKISFEIMHLSECDPNVTQNACDCDYLDILDGNGPYSPEIERVCGHDTPADLITTKNSVFIRFVTDNVRPSTGFKLKVSRIASKCGDLPDLNIPANQTEPIHLYSPNQGDRKYLPNMNCLWEVKAPYGKIFDIRFNRFELENSTNCEKDFLRIEDENLSDRVVEGLGQEFIYRGKSFNAFSPNFYTGVAGPVAPHIYCSSGAPTDYLSSSSSIKIQFKSDSEGEASGFDLSILLLDSCARNYTALQGRLKSSDDYPNTCKSTIKVPENYTISLFFTRFYMFESDCTKSFLKVYDGTFEDGTLISTHCGYVVPNPIFSTKNQLSLIFHYGGDGTVYSKGNYDLMYVATDKGRGCGGEIFNYGGIFSSPMYPNNNRTGYDCTWTVNVPQNLKVAMRFSVFDMGGKQTCASDYVEFLEEDEMGEAASLRKYCGEDVPEIYVSSKSKVRVHYVQTVNFSGTGWLIHFMGIQEGSTPQDW